MTDEQDPIKASKAWIVDQGWAEEEADNLMGALEADSGERLWELMPKWFTHVGEVRKYMTMLELIAMGIVTVTADADGEWLYSLKDGFRESPEGQRLAAEYGLAT